MITNPRREVSPERLERASRLCELSARIYEGVLSGEIGLQQLGLVIDEAFQVESEALTSRIAELEAELRNAI